MPDYEKIIIKSVSVLIDGHAHFETKDLLLTRAEKGYTITAIEPKIETEGAKTVDGYGLTAMPSFVDLFCRMGEPGGDKQSVDPGDILHRLAQKFVGQTFVHPVRKGDGARAFQGGVIAQLFSGTADRKGGCKQYAASCTFRSRA